LFGRDLPKRELRRYSDPIIKKYLKYYDIKILLATEAITSERISSN